MTVESTAILDFKGRQGGEGQCAAIAIGHSDPDIAIFQDGGRQRSWIFKSSNV